MRTRTTHRNGNGDAPEPAATIYLCDPLRRHKRTQCTTCGNGFNEPWVRFFLNADLDFPACKKCAMDHGFTITRKPGEQRLWCRRAKSGAIIISEEPDRELDDSIDCWITEGDFDG
jgi:hypothetical protein